MDLQHRNLRPLSLKKPLSHGERHFILPRLSRPVPGHLVAPDRISESGSPQPSATRTDLRPALPDPLVRHLIRTLNKQPMTIAELQDSEHAMPVQIYGTIQRARIAGLIVKAIPTKPTTFRFDIPNESTQP